MVTGSVYMKHAKTLMTGISAVVVYACASSAHAQVQSPPPHASQSPTGVVYRGGAFTLQEQDLSIGDDESGLKLVRSYNSSVDSLSDPYLAAAGWTHSFNIFVTSRVVPEQPDFVPPPNYRSKCIFKVVGGGEATEFLMQAVFVPQQTSCGGMQNGQLVPLQESSGLLEIVQASTPFFRYTGKDGSVINFTPGNNGRASNWIKPDGTRLDFNYDAGKLKSVISNRGWGIIFESQYKICAVNLTISYVGATTTCPVLSQQVTYTYSPGTYVSSWQLMTSVTRGEQVRRYEYAANDHVNCIKDGQGACLIQNTYQACPEDPYYPNKQPSIRLNDYVVQQRDPTGRTYSYSYHFYNAGAAEDNLCRRPRSNTDEDWRPFLGMTTFINDTAIPGSFKAVTNEEGLLMQTTDQLNRAVGFGYTNQDLSAISYPEGNLRLYDYIAGNLLADRLVAKPGSGSAERKISYTYPDTCTNRIICNRPTTMTNYVGGVTEYVYDPVHGGIARETAPADRNGIRLVKRNRYVQRSAWLKNASGGYVSSAYPVWLLSETRTCSSSATVNDACAAGVGDEVVTSYDYGSNSGPNNLQVRGVVVSSSNGVLRTCFTYDADGRKVSETKPNANLTSCS